jgi:hypothetical protein
MSKILESLMAPYRAGDDAECQRILDAAVPNADKRERSEIASWRARLRDRAGDFAAALKIMTAAQADFDCQTYVALRRANDLAALDRVPDAITALRAAPVAHERADYPGMCRLADFFLCLYLAKEGEMPPHAALDRIPDDFFAIGASDEMLTKKDILDAMAAQGGDR